MTQTVEEIAKDIAERLHAIQAKELELDAINQESLRHAEEIKALDERARKLKQDIASERFVISERIGKKETDIPKFK